MTPEFATKYAAGLLDSIKGAAIVLPRAANVSESSIGRQLFEGVRNCLTLGGKALQAVVDADFDIASFVQGCEQDLALNHESDRDREDDQGDMLVL